MKEKRYNLNIRITKGISKMLFNLRNEHNINISSFIKKKIKEKYDEFN